MTLIERLLLSLQARRNVNVLLRTIIQKFNHDNPIIDSGFQTQVDQPDIVNHISVNTIQILDCGHQFYGQIVQCVCGRAFCLDCAAKSIKSCDRCGSPIAPCCLHHSFTSGRDYCPEHWHWYLWLLGR